MIGKRKAAIMLCLISLFAFLLISCPSEVEMQKLSLPVIESSSSEINEDTIITIKSNEGATIYYTEDGSDPRVSGSRKEYVEAFKPALDSSIVIKAYATMSGYIDSEVAEAEFKYSGNLPAPVFEFENDAVIPFLNVKVIVNAAQGYVVHYTLDGSTPNENSNKAENGLIDLSSFAGESVTIKAYAAKEGMENSEIATVTYQKKKVSSPVINPESQKFLEPIEVSITAEEGAMIYYTLDGSEPSSSSTPYEKPFLLEEAAIVEAIAVMDGCTDSEIATAEYSSKTPVPVITPEDGIVPFLVDNITIKAGENDRIYYSTNGDDPDLSGEYKTGSVTLSMMKEGVVKAIAVRDGYEPSELVSLTIKQAQLPKPVISYPDPFILGESKITITSEVDGVSFIYGSYETEMTKVYSGPFLVTEIDNPNGLYQILVEAQKDGYKPSLWGSETIWVYERDDSLPVFSLPEGTPNAQNMTLEILAPTFVHYTTDGSDPTTKSEIGSSINLSSQIRTVKAIYVMTGDRRVSNVATLNLSDAKDPSLVNGEWISSASDFSIQDGRITTGDYNNRVILDYAISDDVLAVSINGNDDINSEYTFDEASLTLTMGEDTINLTKGDGNTYSGEGVTLILNEEAFSLSIDGTYESGTVEGSTLKADKTVLLSDISDVDVAKGPVSIPKIGTVYRRPEFTITPERGAAIAVNEEVEITLSYDTLPEGISIGDEITYELHSDNGDSSSGSFVYGNSVKYTPTDLSLSYEFTIPVSLSDEGKRNFVIGGEYNVMERYGIPYVGPYTVLTDAFMKGDGIEVGIRDLDSTYNGNNLYFNISSEYNGNDFVFNPNRTFPNGYKAEVMTFNDDTFTQTGAMKGHLDNASADKLPSKQNIKTFYRADDNAGSLSNTTWAGSMDLGSLGSFTLTLTVDENCGYEVCADSLGTAYKGKARYSEEKNMILIDFKNDNQLPYFISVNLSYSYNSADDTLIIYGTEFYRASGDKGSAEGYWIEKNNDDEITRSEFVLDGEWISYRGNLWSGNQEIYIYEGGYNGEFNLQGSGTISFPKSTGEEIDNYYILSYPCLSNDDNTLFVAGLNFSKSN